MHRQKPPHIRDLRSVHLADPQHYTSPRGLEIEHTQLPDSGLVQIHAIYAGGRWQESAPLRAAATAALFSVATGQRTAAQLADQLEQYGARVRMRAGMDHSVLEIHSLEEYIVPVLDLVREMIESPGYRTEDIERYIRRSRDALAMDLQNPEIVAYREITEMLYGPEHPYGYNKNDTLITSLQRHELVAHHDLYKKKPARVFLMANKSPDLINRIDEALGYSPVPNLIPNDPTLGPSTERHRKIHGIGSGLQASLRMARRIPDLRATHRRHLAITDTALGGFFGSRLIKRIREELGYTYGIYTHIERLRQESYWTLSTELGMDYLEDTQREIWSEISRLQDECMPEEELRILRNYLMGNLLLLFNGVDRSFKSYRALYMRGQSVDDLRDYAHELQRITPDDIRSMARRFYQPEEIYELIVR